MTTIEKLKKIKEYKLQLISTIKSKYPDFTDTSFEGIVQKIENLANDNSNTGIITEFTGIKKFTTNEELSVLNNYATIGALLSWDEDSSKYTVWNGDGTKWAYNEIIEDSPYEQLSDKYGEVIAVCIGLGKWAPINWLGLNATNMWQPVDNNTPTTINIYHPLMGHGTGKQNTAYIFELLENHNDNNLNILLLNNTIWDAIKSYSCGNGLKVFLPSNYELLECQSNLCDGHPETIETSFTFCSYNKQIAKLLRCNANRYYWTSNEICCKPTTACAIDFGTGLTTQNYKNAGYYTIVLLNFDIPIISTTISPTTISPTTISPTTTSPNTTTEPSTTT